VNISNNNAIQCRHFSGALLVGSKSKAKGKKGQTFDEYNRDTLGIPCDVVESTVPDRS
jgi:hypothetical protein